MSETTVHAVVLKRRDSGESDRSLIIFSQELGKLDVTAKGARKAASRLAGTSDPLSVASMSLALGKKRLFVTQAQPIHSFRGLRTDYDRLCLALALTEIYAAVLPMEEPFPEAYQLIMRSLLALETHPKPVVASVWSQILLLDVSGFMPQFAECVVTGNPVKEAMAFVSPRAGGYVCDEAAIPFTDRFQVRAEVLYGLSRIGEFESPPPNLRFAEESLATLLPFWKYIAEAQLPANETAVAHVRHAETM